MSLALTWPIVAAVLFGALLHAAWNGLVKSSGDKPLDTALVHGLGALVALPFALWVGLPSPLSWPFIAISLVIHIGYYIALAGAYQHGELGMTYPIMRGSAPATGWWSRPTKATAPSRVCAPPPSSSPTWILNISIITAPPKR